MRRSFGRLAPALLALAALAAGTPPAAAQGEDGGDVLLLADDLVHDRLSDTVTATGAVELSRGARVLRADTLSYDRARDTVSAAGRVVLVEPGGEVLFAERADMAGDLRSGSILGVGILFTDRSRLAAAGGRKTVDGRTELANAVYSPCRPCADDPERPPTWRIRAERVVHDPARKTVSYSDATFDLLGVPVLYTPWYSHSDPTVRRRTGFLTPTFGHSSTFGLTVSQPFFINLSPHSDATITPVFMREGFPVLTAQYREATERGYMRFEGSLTREKLLPGDPELNGRPRGHLNLVGDFDLGRHRDMHWGYGFAAARATDATYLARYDFGREPFLGRGVSAGGPEGSGAGGFGMARGGTFLTQNAWLHGRGDRRWISVDAFRFQSLNPDADSSLTPIVAPLVDVGYRGGAGFAGGVWTFRGNARALTRRSGSDNRRLSAILGWQAPFATRLGDRYMFRASLRADGYHVAGLRNADDPAAPERGGFASRLLPQAMLDWRWPWVRAGDSRHYFIEPQVLAIAAPQGRNPSLIENDDSLAFEYDEINLFSENRFPGLDRVEGGVRVNYGLRLGTVETGGARTELMIGQTWRRKPDDTFETGTGLAHSLSDYVGRVLVKPRRYLDLAARFRLDRRTLSIRRGSLSVSGGPGRLRGTLSWTRLSNAATTTGLPSIVNQVTASATWQIDPFWRFTARHRRDLHGEGGALLSAAGLYYRDECLSAGVEITKNFTHQRDVKDTTEFIFLFKLRNIID